MKYIIIFLTLLLSAPNVVANPYSDHKITCEEMEEFPELVFDSKGLDLGSGSTSPTKIDYNCPKSLGELDFLKSIVQQSNNIRTPSNFLSCTGTIAYAQSRGYYFSLARFGYYPQDKSYLTESDDIRGRKFFEEWSYYSLHNRKIYNNYLSELERTKPLLIDWYLNNHAIDYKTAQKYTDQALFRISNYGFGRFTRSWKPEKLVPFTQEAIKGDYAGFLRSIKSASQDQKLNSLRRLLVHDLDIEVIQKLVLHSRTFESNRKSEPILSYAIESPTKLQFLLQAGFPPDQENRFGKTALFYAIQHGQYKSVEILLNNGANVNHAYQNNKGEDLYCTEIERWGRTPLMHAAQHSDIKMLKILLDNGASLHTKDVKNSSALDYAKDNRKHQNEKFLSMELNSENK